MAFKQLYVFVEGQDDARFFSCLILPLLEVNYDTVMVQKYAHQKKEKVANFIQTINKMGADYIYLADINSAPCVTEKKETIGNRIKHIDDDRIAIVIKEIESWYLAGLDDKSSTHLGITPLKITGEITKEQFNSIIPKSFKNSRIDFMQEILKLFNLEIGKIKNSSLGYFIDKYIAAG